MISVQEFVKGDTVSFTTPKDRWEPKQERTGVITGVNNGRACVNCQGAYFAAWTKDLTLVKKA